MKTNYIFIKDYETQVPVYGEVKPMVDGVIQPREKKGTRQLKILKGAKVFAQQERGGELLSLVYDGEKLSIDKSYLSLDVSNDTSVVDNNVNLSSQDDNRGVASNDIKSGKKIVLSKEKSTSIFTTKNIIIGLLVIGGTVYFLKYKNLI